MDGVGGPSDAVAGGQAPGVNAAPPQGGDLTADVSSVMEQFAAVVTGLRRLGDGLAVGNSWSLCDDDVVALLRLQAVSGAINDALGHVLVREADVRGLAGQAGATSTVAWLAQVLTLTPGEASARVRTASELALRCHDTASALATGRINDAQARAVTRAVAGIGVHASAAETAEAEAMLLGFAADSHAGLLARYGGKIEEMVNPDGPGEREELARRKRFFELHDRGNGQFAARGCLDAEGAAIVNAAIDALAAPRPAGEAERDERSAGQRRADALVEACAGFLRLGDLAGTRGSAVQVTVTIPLSSLLGASGSGSGESGGHGADGWAATGEALGAETVRKLACDAGVTAVITDALGAPLNVGRARRSVTAPIWAALIVRDRGCVFPGCSRPPGWCQAHHILHWVDDGETSLDNTALLCRHHHDAVHHRGWQIRLGPDRIPELIAPPWIDPGGSPRRNHYWRLHHRDPMAPGSAVPSEPGVAIGCPA